MGFKFNRLFANKESSRRLHNILRFAEYCVCNPEVAKLYHSSIFFIVKIYTEKINLQLNEDVMLDLRSGNQYDPLGDFYERYMKPIEINRDFDIILSRDPVVTNIWNQESLANNFNNFSNSENRFEPNELHHRFRLILPMGVAEFHDGNHSINCGILKGDGIVHGYSKSKNGHIKADIYDMSHLYDDYYYDGTYFRSHKNVKTKIRGSFESGVIFELGRIIKGHEISFFDRL